MSTVAPQTGPSRPRDLVKMAAQLPRPKRKPDLQAEARASAKLSKVLASDPSAAPSCVLEIARSLCHAGSAGLTVLRTDRIDATNMRWDLVRGALAPYEGMEAPRANSPCGLCLDAGTTILVPQPIRAFSWLEDTRPAIVETLIVLLHDHAGAVYGTLWIAHHEPDARCTYDDVRILEQLAGQLMLAFRLQQQEQIRRVHAEAAELETGRALLFKDAMLDEVNHRTKNTLLAASALLTMQANATDLVEVRRALLDSRARLQLLAKVHTLLCIEPDHTQSVFMPELLQAVGDALGGSFGGTRANVRVEVSCDPVSLPADDAIAIALLSNEAVTNAYKHAFDDKSSGTISVELHGSAEHGLVLRISDTGTGASFADSKHGMGLQLMRILSTQVHGVLDLAAGADGVGTHVTLTIERATADVLPTQPEVSIMYPAGTVT